MPLMHRRNFILVIWAVCLVFLHVQHSAVKQTALNSHLDDHLKKQWKPDAKEVAALFEKAEREHQRKKRQSAAHKSITNVTSTFFKRVPVSKDTLAILRTMDKLTYVTSNTRMIHICNK